VIWFHRLAEFDRKERVGIALRQWSTRLCLAAIALATLSACTGATPGVVKEPTATPPRVVAALAPQTQADPTETPTTQQTAEPTKKPKKEKSPTPEPTARVSPPEDDNSGFSQVFDRGTSGRREIALTFDAGADRGFAEEILDTLKEYGIKASFGMTGHWAEENPDLVKRMVREGHMIFNHTWTHRSFTGYSTADWDEGVLTAEERKQELDDTAELIAKLTRGYDVAPYFRPPYGDLDDSVLADVAADGYWVTVMWSCDSLGWNGASVEQIVERCGTDMAPGDIILMHVGAESLDAEALAPMIESLQSEGFDFVTIEELLQP
jgi:peptidoglycan/xylan/chitin deacetylase (PgdA/CDA1 family)